MKKPLILTAMELESRIVGKALASSGLVFDMQVVGLRACRMPATFNGAGMIIMAGLAGGLDPGLRIGEIVYDGAIHTADQMVATPADKAKLFGETGARAVDMENAIVRRAAKTAGIPFVGIRAISDTAEETLDPDLLKLVDETGRVRPLAAVSLFLRRPGLIGQARRLQGNSHVALAALGDAVMRELKKANG